MNTPTVIVEYNTIFKSCLLSSVVHVMNNPKVFMKLINSSKLNHKNHQKFEGESSKDTFCKIKN